MRKEKALIELLRGLVGIVSDEAERNPEFASRLEALLSALPEKRAARKKPAAAINLEQVPDVYAECKARGEAEFRLWLRDQPIEMLRAVIRQHDLDAARRTAKWKDTEKLSAFIADQIQLRLARGASFLKS